MKKVIPKSCISQSDTNYFIYCQVPGVKKENLDINLSDEILHIHARPTYDIKEDMKALNTEFSITKVFERHFILGNRVDKESINAKIEEGILEVSLAKSKEILGKKIEIQ